MAGVSPTDDSRPEVRLRLRRVISSYQDDIGGLPTLGEFLEIIGLALLSVSEGGDLPAGVAGFSAEVGRKRYQPQRDSRVPELNDAIFAETASFLVAVGAVRGRATSPDEFAAAVLDVLQDDDVAFEDVRGPDVSRLAAVVSRSTVRPRVGDILAIRVRESGYRMAVVTARNRFGTAIGLFGRPAAIPRLTAASIDSAATRSVYTDDQLIISGKWKVVGHDERLLSSFPSDPDIYHGPDPIFPNVDLGDFGAAESPSGTLRKVAKSEAEEVGLLNDSYRQAFVSEHLHQLLVSGEI
ncbi:hypothetical protein [Actinoplanes sichuanensis]|uniref:Uncharacterized protein n=1 Tax=Actinoplanes sichuanensis TaxID=512349 RepID=A0ABW4A536_9ACTN|nr:hypothetical protein [Actinoplanes sichuanensis]